MIFAILVGLLIVYASAGAVFVAYTANDVARPEPCDWPLIVIALWLWPFGLYAIYLERKD